jgi:hypothetical protein
MNALKIAAIGAEAAILGSTAAVAWGLVAGSGNLLIAAPIVVAATAVELLRLPLVMRAPKLRLLSATAALVLAGALSLVTAETLALGVEGLLNARALAVTSAETRLAEAQVSFNAAKADRDRREGDRVSLVAAIATAQKHSEEIGRETVTLQANPSVSAYRTRKGWAAPGAAAANAAVSANARAQADHAKRAEAAEADLTAARAALAALKPVDLKVEEEKLVEATRSVDRERAASPMHRLAASLFKVEPGKLRVEDYEAVRRAVTLSIAVILAIGTLAAGLISELPERGSKPSKLALALRKMIGARRKTLCRIKERVEFKDRIRVVHIPVDRATGLVVDPDGGKL